MCNFLSGIILKNGDVITNPLVNSHEDIIEDAGLSGKDNHIRYFARFEFTPFEREYHNLDKYTLRIDEESSPDWLTDEFKEKIERHCRLMLSNIVLTGKCKKKLIAGRSVILSNFDGKNTNFKNCQIIYIDNSTTGDIAKSTTGDIDNSTTGNIANSTTGNIANSTTGYIDNSTTGNIYKSTIGDIYKSTIGNIAKSSSVKSIKSSVCNDVHYDENCNIIN